jgi:Monooxygenase af470-like
MQTTVNRQTVDLSLYPDLVVIHLGMRVNRTTGLKTLFGFGPKISGSVTAQPKGLLSHEFFVMSLFPMHLGMRQYWTDMESLLSWSRSEPHMVEELPSRHRRHRFLA